MADQHNSNIPAVGNQIASDIPDIKENLEYHKDVFQNFVNAWSNSTASGVYPAKWNRTALTNADTAYTMLTSDIIMECDMTDGVLEIDLVAAATLGAGRYFIVKVTNATNAVTLDPNGAETIHGAANLVLDTLNEAVLVYCDGSNFLIADWYNPALDVPNNTWVVAVDNAGTGTVNIIKANTSDEVVLGTTNGMVMAEQASAPTTAANQMGIYSKALDGQSELYAVEESDGDEVGITDQGRLALPKNYISGLTMSIGTDTDHDVDIAAGLARDSSDGVNLNTTGLTFAIDSGGAILGLFSDDLAVDTWYHTFVVRKDSDGSVSGGFDSNIGCTSIPAGYTEYRRAGSVLTDGSSNLVPFYQWDNFVLWSNPVLEFEVDEDDTANTRTLAGVPTGVECLVLLNVYVYHATAAAELRISSLNVDDEAPAPDAAPLAELGTSLVSGTAGRGFSQVWVLTNTSAQIRTRADQASTAVKVSTQAYIDLRGREG